MLKIAAPLDRKQIQQLLPHRPPILMLDRVPEAGSEKVVAIKEVLADDPCLQGHFPGHPVMPGVFIIEAMAQTSLLLYICNFGLNNWLYLTESRTRFHAPVFPGHQLQIVATRIKLLKEMCLMAAEASVQDTIVAESRLSFAVADLDIG